MAVYGRHREKWDPTRKKSKVSKNITYELVDSTITTSAMPDGSSGVSRTFKRHVLSDTLFTHLSVNENSEIKLLDAERQTQDAKYTYWLCDYQTSPLMVLPTTYTPKAVKVEASRFCHAIDFENRPTGGDSNTDQQTHNYIRQTDGSTEYGQWTPAQLFGDTGTYNDAGARQIYISFWIKTHQANADDDGHTFAHFARYGESTNSAPSLVQPFLGFYINSSGGASMRLMGDWDNNPTVNNSVDAGEKYVTVGGGDNTKLDFVSVSSDNSMITPGEWHYVTFALKFTAGLNKNEFLSNTMVFVDGHKTAVPATIDKGTHFDLFGNDDTHWEWQFGSLINSIGSYDSGDDKVRRSSGFSGALGEFTVITQSGATDAERIAKCKFLYEAQKEGAFNLHSGIHSASPRLEQLDLDRDSLYPANFSLENYTSAAYQPVVSQVSADSVSRFTEGYISDASAKTGRGGVGYTFSPSGTVESYTEKASQRFIQSTYNGTTETIVSMPHLRLNPSDTLLTSGDWYSDARSEFFPEDLDATTGFVINKANDTAGHIPIVSDELYREHHTLETAQKFVEFDVPEEYKDCFVIDIPLPNTANLHLGTDRQEIHQNGLTELARIEEGGGTVDIDPRARIANMAYYNFKDKQWEVLEPGPSRTGKPNDYGLDAANPQDTTFIDQNAIGFSPMTGIIVPNNEKKAKSLLPLYGAPTSDFGFPFAAHYAPADGQTINLKKYINEPMILEGWEIKTKVKPVVGWHEYDSSDLTGPDGEFYATTTTNPNSGKSPFYYGGHGEAAVFFDEAINVTGFDQAIYDTTNKYMYGKTVPVTAMNGGVEIQPTKEAKGLVTNGVTAFLLKKPGLTDVGLLESNFLDIKDRKKLRKLTDLTAGGVLASSWGDLGDANNEVFSDTTYAGHVVSPTLVNRSSGNNFTNATSNKLIGWLQHVFHNDQYAKDATTRKFWIRNDSASDGPVETSEYTFSDGDSILSMLNKENATYVANLLYDNTNEYDLHAIGRMKTPSQFVDGVPISNFFIRNEALGAPHGLGIRTTSGDTSKKYVIATGSDSSLNISDSTLSSHDITPKFAGATTTTTVAIPKINFPTIRIGTDSVTEFHQKINTFDKHYETAQVILDPNDELILGIQNSIATTYASQQIKSGDQFIRWGRTRLDIPAQDPSTGTSFLRLFVKRTRDDKDFNTIADSSNYNQNVNRDLGDHVIGDRFIVPSPTEYSGSMADDIMGPTTFTAPVMEIDVRVDTNMVNQNAVGGFTSSEADWENAINSLGQYGQYPLTNTRAEGLENFNIKWYNASNLLFINREAESALRPRFPAIPWTDDGFGGIKGTWFIASTIYHWPIAGPGIGNAGAGAPNHNDGETPYSSNISGNKNARFRAFANPRELNTNSSMSTDQQKIVVNGDGNDISLLGYNSPGMSAYSLKLMLPVFKKPIGFTDLTAYPSIIECEFRLVKIIDGGYDYPGGPSYLANSGSGNYANLPQYEDGTEMKVGDAFYFYADYDDLESSDPLVPKQKIVKLDLSTSFDTSTTPDKDQRVMRNWVGQRDTEGGPLIFIVAGHLDMAAASPNDLAKPRGASAGSASHYTLSFKDVSSIISRIAYLHSAWDPSILAQVENHWNGAIITANSFDTFVNMPDGHDGNFKIKIPPDVVLRRLFSSYQKDINDALSFKLCDVEITEGTPVGDESDSVIDNKIRLYKTSAPTVITGHSFAYGTGGPAYGGLLDNDTNDDGTTGDLNYTVERTNFIADYFLPMTNGDVDNGTPVASGGTKLTHKMYRIDYTNLTRSFPKLVITKETYNEEINRRIDRFVQRRRTSTNTNPDAGGPLVAGPFGKLKSNIKLIGNKTIMDSFTSAALVKDKGGYCPTHAHGSKAECNAFVGTGHADSGDGTSNVWVETKYFTTVSDVPSDFPFENTEERVSRVSDYVQDIKVKLNTDTAGGISSTNSSTVAITNDTDDSSVGTYNWGYTVDNVGADTEDSLGFLRLTNYIQKEFRGNEDFTDKTVSDFLVGFGDGPQGRNVLRPSLRRVGLAFVGGPIGALVDGVVTQTGGTPVKFSNEFIVDVPRGARFGQYNTSPMKGTYVYAYNHYGHLRDMLEQSLDTKFAGHIFDERLFGSPVVVNAINVTNPEVPKLLENTSRYNKTKNATVSKPYIENNYESVQQPTNIQNETLSVNVAGSLGSSAALNPGNISSGIRRR